MDCSYLIDEGRMGSPKMMSVGLHCRLARPGPVAGISEFIDFAKSHHRDVWICTREEIADHWYKNHPPQMSVTQMPGSAPAEPDRRDTWTGPNSPGTNPDNDDDIDEADGDII